MDLPEDFSPLTQVLNFTSVDGPAQLNFQQLDDYLRSSIQVSVIYGCTVGCAGLMGIILWVVSKNRRTPIFLLNQLSLFFLIVHSALYIAYLMGPFNSITSEFTGFDMSTAGARRVTIATDLIQVLLIACIEGSLVFQVKIIFRSPEVYKAGIFLTVVSACFGLATVGSYLAACIRSIISLSTGEALSDILVNLPIILFAVSTVFICLTLMTKLGLAIRSRRYLGLKQFDTFHILIIMTTQTMIIPMILVILSFGYITTIYTRLTPIAIMLVTLELPLSSMWATSANNSSEPSSTGGSFISKTSSRSSQPTMITSNGSTLYGDMMSPDLEKQNKLDASAFALYPVVKKTEVESPHGFDSYELDEEDRELWEEAHRLTDMYHESGDKSDELVSTVIHNIN